MSSQEKIIAAIQGLLQKPVKAEAGSRLKEDLGMSSLNLVELTVALHGTFGIDIGRRAVERKANPQTIADIVALLE